MIIRVCDLETTGLTAEDDVVEIGGVDVGPDDAVLVGHTLVKPNRPISVEAMAAHHIRDDDCLDAPTWADVRTAWVTDAKVEAFAAHKASFEEQWITADLRGGRPLICTWKAALRRWPDAPSHSLQALRYYLKLELGTESMPPHRALPDAVAAAALLRELLKDVKVEQLIQWSAEPPLFPTCPIGEFRGKRWADVEQGFLEWTAGKQGMDPDIVWNAKRELGRRADQKKDAYCATALALIKAAVTVEDLRCWFAWEADARTRLGIYPASRHYQIIVDACAAMTATLPPAIPKPEAA